MHRTLEKCSMDVLLNCICILATMNFVQRAEGLQLQNYTWNVSETSPVGTVVGAVEVTTPLTNLTCTISANTKIQEYFTISSRTCVVTLKKSLQDDPDKSTIYRIGVEVSGYEISSSQSSTATIEVTINRDLYSPVITNLPATVGINETFGPGNFVYKADARDGDQNSKIVCEIVPSYYFQINSATCEVTLRNSVLLDSQTFYQVPIQVYDTNWPNNKVTRNLTVNVIRNENGPVFTGPSTANINTNFPPGETVLLLTATDADGDRLTFSKVNPNDNSSNNFIVDSTDGRIILVKPLTGSGTYTFDAQATDNRSPVKNVTQTIKIFVTNVSFPPYFVNAPYNATININAVVNSEVLANVRADKQYLVGYIKYRLAGGVPADAINFFSIDANNGRISLRQRLDTNSSMMNRNSVVLFIETYDDKVLSEVISTTCMVNIQRNLGPPIFTLPDYIATMEDYAPPGSSVITVGATDNDPLPPENIILFKLDTSRGPADYFSINSYTGLITVTQRVSSDPAKLSSYALYVLAQDPSLEPKSSTAVVRINVNRNIAPNFEGRPLNVQIFDTVEIMSPFLTASASDPDSRLRPYSDNSKLDFSIINLNNYTDVRKIFTIDSKGQISAVRSLQNLPNSTYTFQAIVSDRGSPPLSDVTMVTVTILPSPVLAFTGSSGAYNLPETNPVPSVIDAVTVNNVSARGIIIFDIIADGFAKSAFNISSTTGVITQILPFSDDPLKSISYLLTVRAYVQNNPTMQAYKTIRINVDRNPTSPQFTQKIFTFTIPESQVLGNVFGNITAADPDNGTAGELTYTISRVFNNPLSSYTFFYVNPSTGDMSLSRSLLDDRNTLFYTFPVKVTDNGVPQLSATATCTVNVMRNSNAPVFVPSRTYYLEISEDFPVGQAIIDLNTTDADNQNVSYSIERNDINTLYFNINKTTGVISLAASLLRVYNSHFNLTVLASDLQLPPGVAEAYVNIYVVRNPSQPQFASKVYDRNLSEYQGVTSPLLNVVATDADSPSSDSGRVTYYIFNQTAISPTPTADFKTDFFTVGSNNGQIYLSRPLTTLESADVYHIYVRAQDGAITPKYDTTLVKINIVRDLFRPEFGAPSYSAVISESQDINSEIINVAAVDKDVNVDLNRGTPNAQVVYELRDFQESNKQSRYFGVTEAGIIYKKQATTGNSGSETFLFQVVASDKNWQKNMFSVANVSITVSYVGSVNGELGFIQPLYLLNIKENTAVNNTSSILLLDIENQDNYQVTCTILGGSDTFIVKGVNNEKDCGLFLTSALDRESRDTYELTVSAQSKALTETGRRKRQAMCRYNTWAQSRIVITVGDVNDNTPQWVHVPYPRNTVQPPDGTQGIFITAVDHSAPTETVAIQLKAIDSDMGLNGEVKYVLDVPATCQPPFRIDHASGALLTKEIPPEDRTSKVLPYEITAVAYDLGVEQEGSKYVRAKCFINLIRDSNRFVMTVTDKDYAQVISDKEIYRIALQQASNFVIIIERIEAKRDSRNGGIDLKSTDIVFVAAATMAPYQLINNTDTNAASLLTSAQALARVKDAFHGSPSTAVDVVPLAYSRDSAVLHVLTKSYIWWMDDPWAALIALAAIISLLSVVGIIVLEFTYARYMNYITVYRKHLHDLPTRPESETQSITMFIPVEEADIQYNEIEMKIDTSQLEATHAHKTDHPVSATEKKMTTDTRLKPIPDITISAVQ